ncbi:hypothetical protein KSS87_019008 [Heliosperma pusillum]|nr:hypothetical protein KSS87_022545 [Heliosperma pusillum]KAH9614479.1 hypothetical protein KSS87_019008 [Heliosperma pusillum]
MQTMRNEGRLTQGVTLQKMGNVLEPVSSTISLTLLSYRWW